MVSLNLDEFIALAEAVGKFELWDGEPTAYPVFGAREADVLDALLRALHRHLDRHPLGCCTPPQTMFVLPGDPLAVVTPVIGYVSAERRRLVIDRERPLPFAPDFAVELRSRMNDEERIAAKVDRYLGAGSVLVWEIDADEETVSVHCPCRPVETLGRGEILTADPALPGFSLPVADMFAPD